MRNSTRSALIALAAALVLTFALSTASARNLSTSNQNIRVTWRSLEFVPSEGFAGPIRCPVTMEGSFTSRTILKLAGNIIGNVTAAVVGQASCTNGIAAAFNGRESYNGTTAPNLFPWNITYEAFAGTLPNITSINILFRHFRFGIRDNSGFCTAQYGTINDNVTATAAREAGGAVTTITPVAGRAVLTKFREDNDPLNVCPASGSAAGASQPITLLGSTFTRVTITLI